jgi:hypothetical protein
MEFEVLLGGVSPKSGLPPAPSSPSGERLADGFNHRAAAGGGTRPRHSA